MNTEPVQRIGSLFIPGSRDQTSDRGREADTGRAVHAEGARERSERQSSRPDMTGRLSDVDNRPVVLSRVDVTPPFPRALGPALAGPIPLHLANNCQELSI